MLRPWKPFLSRLHPSYLTLYCSLVSFVLYFSSAAFENPTFSINYDGVQWVHGVELKTALALAQLSGFVVAKVVGMKLIPEMNRENSSRALALFACALTAQAGYILHAIVPIQFKVIGLFLTGIPEGLIWGIAVSYVEGREGTDFIIAIMSAADILSGGVAKDVGLAIFHAGVDQFWMPAVAGALFFIPFCLAVFALHQIPPPSDRDVEAKVARGQMFARDRKAFVKDNWPGVLAILIAYFFLNAYNDYRDTFGAELFEAMDESLEPGIYTKCELAVAGAVTLVVASMVFIRSNYIGMMANLALIFFGFTLAAATVAIDRLLDMSALLFMFCTGMANFFALIPLNAPFWERLVACLQTDNLTSSFPIQLTGTVGCLGTATLYLLLSVMPWNHFEFFCYMSYFLAVVSGGCTIVAAVYFGIRLKKRRRIHRSSSFSSSGGSAYSQSIKAVSEIIEFKKSDTIDYTLEIK